MKKRAKMTKKHQKLWNFSIKLKFFCQNVYFNLKLLKIYGIILISRIEKGSVKIYFKQ